MKCKLLATGIAALTFAFAACDDTTDTIGTSLTADIDNLQVTVDTFGVASSTIISDSVLSRNITGYLGRVKDPLTGTIVNGDFMVQFTTLTNFQMPERDSIASIKDGEIIADSCDIRLYYTSFFGDSLSQMKLTAYELKEPMREDTTYYSNFSPFSARYIRHFSNGDTGIRQNRSYTLADLTENDSLRSLSDYSRNIRIRLNEPYTDKDGITYNNYGTYILRKYYAQEDNPVDFHNPYRFIHNIVPGFFIKMTGGIGSMAYIASSQLNIYIRINNGETIQTASTSFNSTEEVLQTTTFSNEKEKFKQLSEDNSCTYLKTPAGLFTELELPVEKIYNGHENDSINTAKLTLRRINDFVDQTYALGAPSYILMVPKDSLYTFFEHNKVANNKTSFIASCLNSNNVATGSYTFNNISNLISAMYRGPRTENWNKVILVPVTVNYTTTSGGLTTLNKVTHDMSLSSTRLERGTNDDSSPIKLNVIYSKFNGR